jgi:hypothetical protein
VTTRNELFLDTSFGLALVLRDDRHHDVAQRVAEEIERSRTPIVTTSGVILELGNALSRLHLRSIGEGLVRDLQADTRIEVAIIDRPLLNIGFEMYRQFTDKEWGLTDCISFVVMQERGITEALTADRHFVQAGFRALLLETNS